MEVLEQAEENHYHDLDDVCLAIQNDANGTVHFNPSAASHYDLPAADDPTLIRIVPGDGYMSMTDSTSQRKEPEHLESTDEEDEAVSQEDIEQLRREVLQAAVKNSSDA